MWSADYGDRLKMWNCEHSKDVWGTSSQRFSFTTGKTEKVFITWLLHFRKSPFFSFFPIKKKGKKKYPKHKPPSVFRCCVQGSTAIKQVVEVPTLLLFYCKEEHERSCSPNALNVRSRANAS